MQKQSKLRGKKWLALLAMAPFLLALTAHAQTTPNVQVEILGVGAASLLGSDLTDPENDGLDALGAATDPSWNWADITSSHEPDFEGGENSFNIFDNKVGGGNDKWCCDDPIPDNPVWVAVEFKEAVSLTHFTVTSGNDTPTRDPTDWAIQGSADGITYTDIYHFTDTTVPWDARNQVVKFTLPPGTPPSKFIRYIAYDTPDTLHQINEIEYFGTVGGTGAVDTDKDGMPDAYETQMGFNPNDATDAAKDFDGDGVSNLDEYKAGTDPIDTTKPTLVSTTTTGTFDTVVLTFSEALDPATATNLVNYTVSPTLAVTGATYRNKVVTLTTAKQTPNATAYTVSVKGVTDLSKNQVAADTTGSFYSYLMTKTGVLKFSYWGTITGTPVENLTTDPRYPASPEMVTSLFSFNTRDAFPDDTHENYGGTVEGYLTPTETGTYDFFLRSDDASQLWLSTDETEAKLVLVAEEIGCCQAFLEPNPDQGAAWHDNGVGVGQTTLTPISLVANTKYFIRAIYKEGGGGDYVQVAWRKSTDKTPAASLLPIPGKFFSSAVDLPAPAEGRFLSQTPAANATGVKPNAPIRLVHTDGKTEWTAANVTVKVDGVAVTPTFTKERNEATIEVPSTTLLPSKSTHTVTVGYVDPGGKPATREWSFETYAYASTTKDVVKGIPGLVVGNAKFSANAGGHTGKTNDYAIDFGRTGGAWVDIINASFLNDATKNDQLSFAFWSKLYNVSASSAFWAFSPSSSSGGRGFQGHAPWSDNQIYFDTAGCCDAATQRINANIDTFAGYTGDDGFWTNNWHHFVFTKKADQKNVYIDGKLFLNGSNSNPLPADFTEIGLGTDGVPGPDFMHGLLDDFAVFSTAVTEADALKLFQGTSPKDLTGETLIALWDFNDATSTGTGASISNLTVSSDRKSFSITYTGTLQSGDTVIGPWADVPNTTSPATIPIGTESKKFYRVH